MTPGVYINKIPKPTLLNAQPTAVPAFIGYTEWARDESGNDLNLQARRVESLEEYEALFGKEKAVRGYQINLDIDGEIIACFPISNRYFLHESVELFYENGGGACYIISVETYDSSFGPNDILNVNLENGLNKAAKIQEATLIVIPDAVGQNVFEISQDNYESNNALTGIECGSLQKNTLSQCAKKQDRFGIFDLLRTGNDVEDFRGYIGTSNLNYGAAYYPWLRKEGVKAFEYTDVTEILINDTTGTPYNLLDQVNDLMDFYVNNFLYYTIFSKPPKSLSKNRLKDRFQALKEKVQADNQADYRTNFSDLFSFLVEIALTVKAVDDSQLVDLEALKNDESLITSFVNLASLQNTTELTGANGILYQNINLSTLGGTGWLGYNDDTPPTALNLSDIAAQDTSIFNDTSANNQTKAAEALTRLQNIVNVDKIVAALATAYAAWRNLFDEEERKLSLEDPTFRKYAAAIETKMSLVPPSGAVAGLYAKTDRQQGIWVPPANTSLNAVVGPALKITNAEQGRLNVATSGKSINAIRAFSGKGTTVWGARTLAGNDREWRYISVRRFYLMVEKTLRAATQPFVFENNNKNTWLKIKAVANSFLTRQWRAGALKGTKKKEAFYIHVGLDETMNEQDILEGRLIVEVGMAVVRPAEFIILNFTHLMDES